MGKVELTAGGRLVKHGSASSYRNHRCRCDECTKAWSDYMRPRMRAYRIKKRKQKKGVKINI